MSPDSIKARFDLSGRVAIVTGASKGIGEAIARGLAEFGARVVVSSRKQEAVDAVAADIKSGGLEATGIACHVGKQEQLQDLVDKTLAKYGSIDILINNAAINPVFGPLSEAGGEVFDKIMEVNVKACHLLSNLCHPHFKKSGKGAIVNIASVEGLKPGMGLGLYSVSKAALIMLTQTQAGEWGRDGIRANAICPGLIQTKFSSALWKEENTLNNIVGDIPAGRIGQAEEIAGLAVYLASDASSYTTGSVFTADGGFIIS